MFTNNAKYKGFKKFAIDEMAEQHLKIKKLEKELENIPLNTKDLIQQLHERICELERIVKNQPLIKKYQKTLDIFLKNAESNNRD